MDSVDYKTVAADLAGIMQQVCEAHSPVIIKRDRAPSVVMLSLEDYEGLQETVFLLQSPKNSQRLQSSIRELKD